jgi:hypothetical protein
MTSRVTTTVQLTTANDGWFVYVDYGSRSEKLPIIAWALLRTESPDGGAGAGEETVEPVVIAGDSHPSCCPTTWRTKPTPGSPSSSGTTRANSHRAAGWPPHC